jgi:uncharacterized protein involved in exopolysaccharide biosynthesis
VTYLITSNMTPIISWLKNLGPHCAGQRSVAYYPHPGTTTTQSIMKIILIACMAVVLRGDGLAAPDQHPVVPVNREQNAKLENAAALQKALQELDGLLTKYTEQHPLVVAKREQIARLQNALALQRPEHEIPQPSLLPQTRRELEEAFTDLNDLLTRYTEQHPKVLAKREQIARLQKALAPQRREHEIPQPSLLLQTRRELDEAFTDLNDLLTRYTEQHPKVLAKREQIARLQKALAPQ